MGKLQVRSWFLSFIMLFALVYQSVHLWEHSLQKKEYSQEEDFHDHSHDEEAGHEHQCSVCDFQILSYSFDFTTSLIPKQIQFIDNQLNAKYFSICSECILFVFNLRAPPLS